MGGEGRKEERRARRGERGKKTGIVGSKASLSSGFCFSCIIVLPRDRLLRRDHEIEYSFPVSKIENSE